jgi:hypothetical protein
MINARVYSCLKLSELNYEVHARMQRAGAIITKLAGIKIASIPNNFIQVLKALSIFIGAGHVCILLFSFLSIIYIQY